VLVDSFPELLPDSEIFENRTPDLPSATVRVQSGQRLRDHITLIVKHRSWTPFRSTLLVIKMCPHMTRTATVGSLASPCWECGQFEHCVWLEPLLINIQLSSSLAPTTRVAH